MTTKEYAFCLLTPEKPSWFWVIAGTLREALKEAEANEMAYMDSSSNAAARSSSVRRNDMGTWVMPIAVVNVHAAVLMTFPLQLERELRIGA